MKYVTLRTIRLLILCASVLVPAIATSQPYRVDFRAVNILTPAQPLDFHFNNTATATISNLGHDSASTLITSFQVPASPLNLKVVIAGSGTSAPLLDRDIAMTTQTEYVAVVHGSAAAPSIKILERPRTQQPMAGRSLLRIFNAVSFDAGSTLDFYFTSTETATIFGGIMRDSATTFRNHLGIPQTLIITEAGSKIPIATLTVPLVELGRMTLIVTGTSKDNLKVYALSGERQNTYQIPLLEGAAGGILPSVRVMHVWPQRTINGKSWQQLDVYTGNDASPRLTGLTYRTASEKFGPFTGDSVTVKFGLYNEGIGTPVYVDAFPVNRDSDYVVILTRFKTGSAIAMTLASPNSVFGLDDSLLIRVAQATDLHGDLTVKIIPFQSADTITTTLAFLQSSAYYRVPRGPYKVEVYKDGAPAPIAVLNDPGTTANPYITLVISAESEGDVHIDALDELLSVRQVFDATTDVETPRVLQSGIAAVPNPTTGQTHVVYEITKRTRVTLGVFDILGRRVATLIDTESMPGHFSVPVDLSGCSDGTYILRLLTGEGDVISLPIVRQ